MQPKLNDFSSSALISVIEASLREFWKNWGSAPQSELYAGPDMVRLYTGVPYPFCNGVSCSQLLPDKLDEVIDQTISYYRERNAIWEWMVGPNSIPASLDALLVKHGLTVRGESIGMAINLHTMKQDIPSPDGLEIISVSDDHTLEMWANTMMEGFQSPMLFPKFVELECSLGYQQSYYRRYLGFLDHEPISTCAMFLGEKVAGIYCVSTLPPARRLGIGAKITQVALDEALALGYNIAVLQSSPMGRSVYQRLGFQPYSTLRAYSPAK